MPLVDYLLLTPLDEEWRTVRNVLCPIPGNLKSKPIEVITYYLWKQAVNQLPFTVGDYLIVAAPMSRKNTGAGIRQRHYGYRRKTVEAEACRFIRHRWKFGAGATSNRRCRRFR